ncbi:AtpZ/AtpI family protein [Occallatibacter savannae]|uniref:AtpZ/AtpI family protein n=1 Tax=Occallatibacter savannae TaxID=1002691 RepID=UPI001EF55C30|nr:AtpZ/AtpI family protein [Occallatibacter savannae]
MRLKNFAASPLVVYNHQGMPFNRPLPDSGSNSKRSSGVDAIVKAETGIQIALILPSSVVICWLIGAWADKHFHQSWISIAGVVFGAVSGLVYIIQYVIRADREDRNGTGSGKGSTGSDQ